MNKFFKMSLVAAAVAVTGTATAGTFELNADKDANANAVIFSAEGLAEAGVNATQYAPAINYTLGANYLVGDELTLTFAIALNAATVYPLNVTVGAATFQKTAEAVGAVTYRVVSGTAATGSVFTLAQNKSTVADLTDATKSGLVMATATVATQTVAASSVTAASAVFDAETSEPEARLLGQSKTQYGKYAVTQKFNAVIDATTVAGAKKFTGGELSDSVTFAYTAAKTMPTQALLGQKVGLNDLTTAKVTTDISLTTDIVLADVAKYTVTAVNGTVGTGVGAALVYPITYTDGTAPAAGDTITITPKADATAPVMVAGAFELTAAVSNLVGAPADVDLGLAGSAKNAGEWTIIGSETINVPYMPYGTGLSQVIYVTNTTDVPVEVSVVAQDDAGTEYDLGLLVNAKANGVTKLATVIKNALAAEGFTAGKVSLDITVAGNAAAGTPGTVKLHSGYNANASDRGFVANTSNGAK